MHRVCRKSPFVVVLGSGGHEYLEGGAVTGHELDGQPVEATGFTKPGNVVIADPARTRCAGQFTGPAPEQLFTGITHACRPHIADIEDQAIAIQNRGHDGCLSKQGQITVGGLHGRQYRRNSVISDKRYSVTYEIPEEMISAKYLILLTQELARFLL